MDWSSNSSRWHMKFHNQKNNFTFYNRFQRNPVNYESKRFKSSLESIDTLDINKIIYKNKLVIVSSICSGLLLLFSDGQILWYYKTIELNTYLLFSIPLCVLIINICKNYICINIFNIIDKSKSSIILNKILKIFINIIFWVLNLILVPFIYLILKIFYLFEIQNTDIFLKSRFGFVVKRYLSLENFTYKVNYKIDDILFRANEQIGSYSISSTKIENMYNNWLLLDRKFERLDMYIEKCVVSQYYLDNTSVFTRFFRDLYSYFGQNPFMGQVFNWCMGLLISSFFSYVVYSYWVGGFTEMVNKVYSLFNFSQTLAEQNTESLKNTNLALADLTNLFLRLNDKIKDFGPQLEVFLPKQKELNNEFRKFVNNQEYENGILMHLSQQLFALQTISTYLLHPSLNLDATQLATVLTFINSYIQEVFAVNRMQGERIPYIDSNRYIQPALSNILQDIYKEYLKKLTPEQAQKIGTVLPNFSELLNQRNIETTFSSSSSPSIISTYSDGSAIGTGLLDNDDRKS